MYSKCNQKWVPCTWKAGQRCHKGDKKTTPSGVRKYHQLASKKIRYHHFVLQIMKRWHCFYHYFNQLITSDYTGDKCLLCGGSTVERKRNKIVADDIKATDGIVAYISLFFGVPITHAGFLCKKCVQDIHAIHNKVRTVSIVDSKINHIWFVRHFFREKCVNCVNIFSCV